MATAEVSAGNTLSYARGESQPALLEMTIGADLAATAASHPGRDALVDLGAGRVLPRGKPGEFCTRGYSVMAGYWNDPVMTAEVIDDEGWMHSGDLAVPACPTRSTAKN